METLDKKRLEFIDFYANKIKQSKDNSWRLEHKQFIDSQIQRANKFYIRLILSENGIVKFQRVTKASDKFTKDFYEFAKNQNN